MPPESFLRNAVKKYGDAISRKNDDIKLNPVIQRRIRDISAFKKPGTRLLDIGCGMGQFVRYAKSRGYKVAAMDKAAACVKNLQNIGIPSYTSLTRVPDHRYDIVTLFDVIEHIKRPHKFLEVVRHKMKKDGLLVLTTPNPAGISSKIIPTRLTRAPVRYSEHVILYTGKSISSMLESNKFHVLNVSTDTLLTWCRTENIWVRKVLNKIVYITLCPFLPYLFMHNLGDNIQIISSCRSPRCTKD